MISNTRCERERETAVSQQSSMISRFLVESLVLARTRRDAAVRRRCASMIVESIKRSESIVITSGNRRVSFGGINIHQLVIPDDRISAKEGTRASPQQPLSFPSSSPPPPSGGRGLLVHVLQRCSVAHSEECGRIVGRSLRFAVTANS